MLQRIAMLILFCALAGGCVRVKPYQRETLASRAMTPDKDEAEAKLDGHVEEYREGSIGGSGVSGGGCGCN
jgi:hypothetical protein